jgi:hypothetical protein
MKLFLEKLDYVTPSKILFFPKNFVLYNFILSSRYQVHSPISMQLNFTHIFLLRGQDNNATTNL